MMNILPDNTRHFVALLQCIQPDGSKTDLRRLSRIAQAMLSMSGRVTMLGLSRWAGKGGSYRTIQRFFNATISWSRVFLCFFKRHQFLPGTEYFLVGDESVVTKSGKETHGLDHFFSGLLNKVVKGIAIFSLSLVSVEERHSYPLQVEQVIRTEAEKTAAKERKKKRVSQAKSTPKKKPGRPKGSRNRDKTQVELSPELQRIKKMLKNQLEMLRNWVTVRYLALDGHFGNNNALQGVRQCGLHLISKLRYDAALHFVYDGQQKRKGPRKQYGQKVNYGLINEDYLVESSVKDGIQTRKTASKLASIKPKCCIMSSLRYSMWLSSPRPISRPVPLRMSTCSPVTYSSTLKRSLTITVSDSKSSSISGMPNSIGAWKIS